MKRLIALALALVALSVAGRWDYRDIKDQIIVAGMSVDLTAGGQKLATFEVANVPADRERPIEPITLSSVGETTQEAILNVAGDLSCSMYIGHAWLLLLSEAVARQGIDKLIALITTHPGYNMMTDIAVVRDVLARDVFDCEAVSSTFISYELNSGFKTDERYVGRSYQTYAYQVYPLLSDPYRGYLVPALSVVERSGTKFVENNGAAIFRQDRLIGFLSPEEVQMYRIATGKVQRTDLRVWLEGGAVSLAVEKCSAKLSVAWRGDAPELTPEFTLEVELKLSTSLLLKMDKQTLLEGRARQAVEAGIRSLLEDAQALRCDYLGFADLLQRRHLPRWNRIKHDWPRIFSELACAVEVRVEVLY